MNTAKKKIGINVKMISYFVLIITCLVLLLTAALYFFYLNQAQQTVRDSIQTTIRIQSERLRETVSQTEIAVDLICDNNIFYYGETSIPELYQLLRGYEKTPSLSESITRYKRLHTALTNYFGFFETVSYYYSVSVYVDPSWNLHPYLRPALTDKYQKNVGIFNGGSVSGEAWYQAAAGQMGAAYWFPDAGLPDRLNMAKQLNCHVYEGGELKTRCLGVINVSFDVSWLSEQFEQENSGYVIIRGRNGDILYRSSELPEWIDLSQITLGNVAEFTGSGSSLLASAEKISDELEIVMLLPAISGGMIIKNANIILLLGIAAILLGWLLVILFVQHMTRPIRTLAAQMSGGSLELLERETGRTDEIGTLYRSYNAMVLQIKQSIRNIELSAEKRKRAELRAIQAQMNPHFIYNTLDTICCLLMLGGNDQIADTVVALSQIIRYNTKKPEQLVALSNEFEILEKYYIIQKLCYEDALLLELAPSEDTLGEPVPKQILQPLVENSVFHGAGMAKKQGVIRVSSRYEGDFLILEVWDNGQNADVDRINALIADSTTVENSDNIGVKGINERIRYIYGTDSGLSFCRDGDGCTIARIKIRRPGQVSPAQAP